MVLEKRGKIILLLIFFSLLLVVLFSQSVYAFGVSPARIDVNYNPGKEYTFTYEISGAHPSKEFDLKIVGDLAKQVKLDRDSVTGNGKFNVILIIPYNLDTPGMNIIHIDVAERIDEELLGTIGTAVALRPAIIINVPYPGKYLDVRLRSEDVNVGEEVKFELHLLSKGEEDVLAFPKLDIFSEDELLKTLSFEPREIVSQAEIKLKKFLDTESFNPGDYKVLATVNYGGEKPATIENEFRIGELIISIVNYTKQVIIKKNTPFEIQLESGWNDNIYGAYADVVIFRGEAKFREFKTTSTDLVSWQKKPIVGYFDAENFTEGFYDANVTLTYFGQDIRKTFSEVLSIEFVKKPFDMDIVYYIGGGFIFLAILIFLIKKFLFNKKRR